jgi:5-formyltetrahydrofolate cyclo-ligase
LENDLPAGAGKTQLRQLFRTRRNALTEAQRNEKSRTIGERLERLDAYRQARTVMFFVTHGSEINTEPMMERAWQQKKDVVVPLVDPETDEIIAMKITCIDGDLEKGSYGVREPRTGCATVSSAVIDLVLVPGLVFDRHGHRLGYGKGYYDRWLKWIPQEKRLGLCFDLQMVECLPKDENDVPVGMIVTEEVVLPIGQKE